MNKELIKIRDILSSNNRPIHTIKKDQQLMAYINANANQLLVKNGNSLQTIIYWLINGIDTFPVCQNPQCENYGKPITKDVYSAKDGYSRIHDQHIHCNNKCAQSDKSTIDKVQNSKLEHFGDKNFNNRKQAEETCLDKYGVSHTSKLKENREKSAQTKYDRYGDRNYCNSTQIQETYLERTGYDHPMHNPEVISKVIKKNLDKFGVEWPVQSKEIREKYINKLFETYGVTCTFKIPGLMDKVRLNYYLETGYWNPAQNPEVQKKTKRKYHYDELNFDSSWELALYIYCKDHNINCIYKPDIKFEYLDPITNTIRYYFPDFIIDNQIIEVKGDHFFNDDGLLCNPFNHSLDQRYLAKYKCMIDNNVLILKYDELLICINYINEKYGNNYFQQFRN